MDSNDVENNIIKKGHIFRVIWPRLTDPGGPKWAYEGFFRCFSLKWTEIVFKGLDCPQDRLFKFFQVQNEVLHQNRPIFGKKWRIDGDQKWFLNVPKYASNYQLSYFLLLGCYLGPLWVPQGDSNGFSEVWWYPKGTKKLFGWKGPKIGAHFWLACFTGLLRTPKCSKLPDCHQDRSVRFFQFQNWVLHQNWPIFGREIQDRQGLKIMWFLKVPKYA